MRTRNHLVLQGVVWLVALTSGLMAQTEVRPIGDFLAAQPDGTRADWIDPNSLNYVVFDAFGKRHPALLTPKTTFDGKVTVRRLADGRAHVAVLLHTRNAFCVGFRATDDQWSVIVRAFGYTPLEVFAGKPMALGSGLTRIEFLMPSPETPLPPLSQIGGPEYPLEDFMTAINCDGELREAGSGYPDGTPGKAHVTQVGLFATGVPGGCPPEKDANCFPCEIIEFKRVGK